MVLPLPPVKLMFLVNEIHVISISFLTELY